MATAPAKRPLSHPHPSVDEDVTDISKYTARRSWTKPASLCPGATSYNTVWWHQLWRVTCSRPSVVSGSPGGARDYTRHEGTRAGTISDGERWGGSRPLGTHGDILSYGGQRAGAIYDTKVKVGALFGILYWPQHLPQRPS